MVGVVDIAGVKMGESAPEGIEICALRRIFELVEVVSALDAVRTGIMTPVLKGRFQGAQRKKSNTVEKETVMNRRGAGIERAGAAGIEVGRAGRGESILAVNKVLRNTYSLLALTLAFSAVVAFASANAPPLNVWLFLIGAYGLLFLTHALANSTWGLLSVFAFTGFMGYGIGPMIGYYLSTQAGTDLVVTALGGTAFIFFGLSGYALTTRRDFSFLRGFIAAGFFVLIAAMVLSLIIQMPALQLALSAGFMLFSSAVILWQTSEIVNGGERNYILATVTLYVSIYNLFMSLLNLLTAFSGND